MTPAVPRAGYRPYVTGSIHGWNRSRSTHIYRMAADSNSECLLHCLPQLLLKFQFYTLKITSVIILFKPKEQEKQLSFCVLRCSIFCVSVRAWLMKILAAGFK